MQRQLISHVVHPAKAILAPQSRSTQLIVLATFADGTKRDVTRWARFEPERRFEYRGERARASYSFRAARYFGLCFVSDRSRRSTIDVLAGSSVRMGVAAASQPLDEIVERQLQRYADRSHPNREESVFLRRIYLVVIGRLPTVSEPARFCNLLNRTSESV